MKWTNENRYRAYSQMSKKEETKLHETVSHSPWRQHYHIQPPTGLLNDPNGFSYYNGMYHLFYQWFPYGAVHGLKHWYHVVSPDLVHWEERGLAIEPDRSYESHGAYSGSGIVHKNKLYLFYTGNQRTADWERIPNQALAIMDEHGSISKHPTPLLIGSPKGYTEHFRDPKVWQVGDDFYFVIGAQRETKTGAALLYHSSDLENWSLVGEIQTELTDFGYMWECPDYFELDGKGIFIFSPQGLEPVGFHYQNIYQSGYLIGQPLDVTTGHFSHNLFYELDAGFDFYAPQSTMTPDGRRILVGWMGLPDIEYPTDPYDWAHCLTLPREISVKEDKLIQKPIRELTKLRGEQFSFCDVIGNFYTEAGTAYEMILTFDAIQAESYGISFRTSDVEKTTLTFNRESRLLTLDRGQSGQVPAQTYGTTRSVLLESSDLLSLHVFVDTSSVELFVNDGEVVLTSRIFPQDVSTGFQAFAEKGTVHVNGTHWSLS
ncbi:glycoside hydrolase family 32 protein [Shouchella lehensis]|uniref:Sucrose-6-phosphate hydrolase n=1 Tax=Shouchella lehensis TaxID=300825 RepID=A0A4Y7WEX7_9BACI|nr:sucrose-6-phosphate hydrolase [Shouchella lehensis]MBG9784908.1 sucrose-6-phosphate hydrolase [Shouchella lehensis]TES46326.1 sucrose-6-phosphate hydrolase [Shouchella lehensis]